MKGRRHALVIALQIATLVAILAVWELLTRTGVIKPFLLAPPSAIGRQILAWATSGVLLPAIADTMYVLLTGYLIGVAGGVVIGMLTGRIAFFRHYFDVFIVFLNSLPRLVLIPFFIILFGFGHAPVRLAETECAEVASASVQRRVTEWGPPFIVS
jgi:NitT/TauT family transport system permease protein